MRERAAKRRSSRLLLPTLLATIAVGILWLGWNLNTVRNRDRARRNLTAGGAAIVAGPMGGGVEGVIRPGKVSEEMPWIRRVLGDEPIGMILFPREPSADDLAKTEYFPEAYILLDLHDQIDDYREIAD